MAAAVDNLAPVKSAITHVIFDMDDVLLDIEIFYTVVQEKILAQFGKTFDWSLKAKMMGKKAIESAKIFVEESGIEDQLTPKEEREGMLQDFVPNLPANARCQTFDQLSSCKWDTHGRGHRVP